MMKQAMKKAIEQYRDWRRNSQRNRKRLIRLVDSWREYKGTPCGGDFYEDMRLFKNKFGVPDGLERYFIDVIERYGSPKIAYETALEMGLYTKAGLIARRATKNPGPEYTDRHNVVIAFAQEASRFGKRILAGKVAQKAIESCLKKDLCEVCLTCNYDDALDIAEKTGLTAQVREISSKLRNANRLIAKLGYNEKPSIRRPVFGGYGGLDYRQMDKVKGIIDRDLVECEDDSYIPRFPVEKLFEKK